MARPRTGKSYRCIVCKKEFYRSPSQIKPGWVKYCSKICMHKRNIGMQHPRWKGGTFINGAGYKMVRIGSKYHYEHRLIVEKVLGRKLLSSESVHHKDENKLNNDPDNLVVLSRSDHQKHHNNGYKRIENRGCWICEELGLKGEHYSRGFCQSHYEKYMRRKRKFAL